MVAGSPLHQEPSAWVRLDGTKALMEVVQDQQLPNAGKSRLWEMLVSIRLTATGTWAVRGHVSDTPAPQRYRPPLQRGGQIALPFETGSSQQTANPLHAHRSSPLVPESPARDARLLYCVTISDSVCNQ